MSATIRNELKREVLKYVKDHGPSSIQTMAEHLREARTELGAIRESEVREVVQPMIVTGKLSYTSGLKIKLGA